MCIRYSTSKKNKWKIPKRTFFNSALDPLCHRSAKIKLLTDHFFLLLKTFVSVLLTGSKSIAPRCVRKPPKIANNCILIVITSKTVRKPGITNNDAIRALSVSHNTTLLLFLAIIRSNCFQTFFFFTGNSDSFKKN